MRPTSYVAHGEHLHRGYLIRRVAHERWSITRHRQIVAHVPTLRDGKVWVNDQLRAPRVRRKP